MGDIHQRQFSYPRRDVSRNYEAIKLGAPRKGKGCPLAESAKLELILSKSTSKFSLDPPCPSERPGNASDSQIIWKI